MQAPRDANSGWAKVFAHVPGVAGHLAFETPLTNIRHRVSGHPLTRGSFVTSREGRAPEGNGHQNGVCPAAPPSRRARREPATQSSWPRAIRTRSGVGGTGGGLNLMKLRHLGVFGAAGVLAVAAYGTPALAHSTRSVAQDATPQPVLHLGIELPLSGGEVANGQPTRNGVLLAIAAGECGRRRRRLQDRRQHAGRRRQRRPRPRPGRQNMQHPRRRRCRLRRRRPVQLERRPGRDPGDQRGRPAPVQPRQHRRRPDQGRLRGLPPVQSGRAQLLPRRHPGRHPGPGRRVVRLQRPWQDQGLRR